MMEEKSFERRGEMGRKDVFPMSVWKDQTCGSLPPATDLQDWCVSTGATWVSRKKLPIKSYNIQ